MVQADVRQVRHPNIGLELDSDECVGPSCQVHLALQPHASAVLLTGTREELRPVAGRRSNRNQERAHIVAIHVVPHRQADRVVGVAGQDHLRLHRVGLPELVAGLCVHVPGAVHSCQRASVVGRRLSRPVNKTAHAERGLPFAEVTLKGARHSVTDRQRFGSRSCCWRKSHSALQQPKIRDSNAGVSGEAQPHSATCVCGQVSGSAGPCALVAAAAAVHGAVHHTGGT
mmetsp:Transcript_23937/g.47175  ORF Transcript_23937/g.47175 Transcript_23937/m.47175 type:complete len:228 (-) Transcript_23937:1118-1801(-)